MLLRFAICDDDTAQIEYLTREVAVWASARGVNVTLGSFRSAEAFNFEYGENENFDILLYSV